MLPAPDSLIEVFKDPSIGFDGFFYQMRFSPGVPSNSIPFNLMVFAAYGPLTMFSSTALPENLDFLASITSIYPFSDLPNNEYNSVVFSAPAPSTVPEPGTMTLLGTALIASGVKRWRARRSALGSTPSRLTAHARVTDRV
jgi:hypothetical protein